MDSYTSKPTALTKETTYSIEPDGLRVGEDGSGSKTIPWSKIASVRLHSVRPRNGARSYFCQIQLKSERFPAVHFSQMRYRGMMTYEDQSGAYNSFVQALVKKVSEQAPGARIWTGEGPIARGIILALVALPALSFAAAGVMGLTGVEDMDGSGIPILLLLASAGMAGFAWWLLRRGQPRTISAQSIPPEVLAPG
jgi:hypothetical protein